VNGKGARTYSPPGTCGCSLARTLGRKRINASPDGRFKGVDGTTSSANAKATGADESLRARMCVCFKQTSLLQSRMET
jgi:hypothetical protein